MTPSAIRGSHNTKFLTFAEKLFIINSVIEMKTTGIKWLDTMEFSIDWLNGVMEFDGSIFDFFKDIALFDDRLRADNWVLLKGGKYHYNQRFCLNGNATFQVCWNASEESPFVPYKKGENNNYGIFISISGDGLRYLQQHQNTLGSLLKYFYYNGFRCSRFDVNCDIFEKDNPLIPVVIEAFRWALIRKEGELGLSTNVQRKSSNFAVYELVDTYHNERCFNCTLGNHSTRFGMFRCYNKWLELKDGRLSDVGDAILAAKGNPDYWYRLEYELHKENAADIFNAFASGKINLENAFHAAAEKIFRVIEQGSVWGNISRFDTNAVWAEFLAHNEYG